MVAGHGTSGRVGNAVRLMASYRLPDRLPQNACGSYWAETSRPDQPIFTEAENLLVLSRWILSHKKKTMSPPQKDGRLWGGKDASGVSKMVITSKSYSNISAFSYRLSPMMRVKRTLHLSTPRFPRKLYSATRLKALGMGLAGAGWGGRKE